MRKEKSQLDLSASCMAPCIVMPASVRVLSNQESPVLTLDLGKLQLSTTQFGSSSEEVAYESNSLQVSGVQLKLAPTIKAWSSGESQIVARCDLGLELQRCMVHHLTLPESRVKLQCAQGIHAELTPLDFGAIVLVVSRLTSKSSLATEQANSFSGPLDTLESPDYANMSQSINSSLETVHEAPAVILPARATLEVLLESGPLSVSYTHLRAHETVLDLVCRLLLEKKKT
eukprot:TRINITY_DN14327_c0_g1_i1.p1 TRINITY_DN14327_c0_g1~~TRINITY_DN14327_c0_g1_i1.p1  ORF type:complete len:230 (-),score=52.91 TRINITY_DN14327_c0_g1_i1:23-712(-)